MMGEHLCFTAWESGTDKAMQVRIRKEKESKGREERGLHSCNLRHAQSSAALIID